jgi:PAS domain S-box-containing protein
MWQMQTTGSPILVHGRGDELRALLAAIIDSSDDAIVSKTLDGIITSWNRGAEKLFGYTANEALGQPIFLIIPENRIAEEHDVLARLRRGEKIDHFETVRRRKDGRDVHISLTVSPIRDAPGTHRWRVQSGARYQRARTRARAARAAARRAPAH